MNENETETNITSEIVAGHGRSLSQAARAFPSYRLDRPVSPATVQRWILKGVRLPDGTMLRLEGRRIGGRWLTSVQAIERFIEAQTPQIADSEPTSPPRTTKQRERAAERAGKELADLGVHMVT